MSISETTQTDEPVAKEKSTRERILDIVVREGMIEREKLVGDALLDDLGVQSLDVVIMLTALEDEFDIYIPIDQTMSDVKTVAELLAAIELMIDNPVPDRYKKS